MRGKGWAVCGWVMRRFWSDRGIDSNRAGSNNPKRPALIENITPEMDALENSEIGRVPWLPGGSVRMLLVWLFFAAVMILFIWGLFR